MTRTLIADFEAGRPVEGVFAVLAKQRRMNKNGDPYLVIELSDSSGRIEGRVWDNADHFDRAVQPGDHVVVVGKPNMYREKLQLDIRRIARAGDSDAADIPESFIPAARRELADLTGELDFLCADIEEPQLAALVTAVWFGPNRDLLVRSPATASDHHAYLGGLVEHTVSVATIAMAAVERHERINRDLVLAAALVHDIGRARELTITTHVGVDEAGALQGHLVLGHEMLIEACVELTTRGLPDPRQCDWWPQLVHAMQQHHSTTDRIRTREGVVLATANALDVRLAGRD
ncbi:MAG: HDIG domain-containing protein [Thermoleophilia bacterium]|nr:HDIG domain-containing protein [Thermoleophilia bacterium]